MVHRPEITEYVQRQRSIDRDRKESINNGGREYYTESGKTGKQIKYKTVAKRKACLRQKRHRAGSVSLFCAIVSSSD